MCTFSLIAVMCLKLQVEIIATIGAGGAWLAQAEEVESSVRCRGEAHNRSCLFHNLYFAQGRFVMFVLQARSHGMGRDIKVMRQNKYTRAWQPAVKKFRRLEGLAAHVARHTLEELRGLSLHFNPMFHHNIGHALFDGLYPAFLALMKFGRQDDPFRPVVGVEQDCFEGVTAFGRLVPGDIVETYLPDAILGKTLHPAMAKIAHILERNRTNASDVPCKFARDVDSSADALGSEFVGTSQEARAQCCNLCSLYHACAAGVLHAGICYLKGACSHGPKSCEYNRGGGRLLCRLSDDVPRDNKKIIVEPLGGEYRGQVSVPEAWLLGRVRRRCWTEDIFQTFGEGGGASLRLFEMERDSRANPSLLLRFEEIVIGCGGTGNMVADPTGAIAGSLPPLNGMARFRDRMLRSHGIHSSAHKQGSQSHTSRHSARTLDVIVIDNKRFSSWDRAALKVVIRQLIQRGAKAEIVNWRAVGHGSNFTAHLERVQRADIYVSSVGTALQYAPFLRDGRVFIALGQVWQRAGRSFPSFMEQQLAGSGTPYLQTLYADPGAILRRSAPSRISRGAEPLHYDHVALNASLLLQLLERAITLVHEGFRIPVPVEENLSAEARVLLDLCAFDPGACSGMQADRNGKNYECALVVWPECVVYEIGPWAQAGPCHVNRRLLRVIRAKYGLPGYGAPEGPPNTTTNEKEGLPFPALATLRNVGAFHLVIVALFVVLGAVAAVATGVAPLTRRWRACYFCCRWSPPLCLRCFFKSAALVPVSERDV